MNKKQILKEQRRIKAERRQTEKMFNDGKEANTVLKVALGVILFIGLSFAVINITNGTWNLFNKVNKESTEIDNKMVIVGTMFNKSDSEYLVLAYDMKDKNSDLYSFLSSNYSKELDLYFLDLSSGFNKDYIGDKTVISNSIDGLKFGGPVLLVINKDKIVKSYVTEDEIISYFNSK